MPALGAAPREPGFWATRSDSCRHDHLAIDSLSSARYHVSRRRASLALLGRSLLMAQGDIV